MIITTTGMQSVLYGGENNTENDIPFKDTTLFSIEVDAVWADDYEDIPEIYIAGDITIGSKAEELISIMGLPTDAMAIGEHEYLTYSSENDDAYFYYEFTIADGVIQSIGVSVY